MAMDQDTRVRFSRSFTLFVICYSVSIGLSVFSCELFYSLLSVELACLSLHFSKSDFYDAAATVAFYERYSRERIDRFLMSS